MSGQATCPRCDSPITDTAYVCPRCADVLAVALRNAAANWEELEAAIAKQTAIVGSGGPPRGSKTLHGPLCDACHHHSCLSVRKSQIRARNEDPIPGETNHISFGAHEDGWVVTNTATTWARLIEEESGRPIPPPAPPEPLRADPVRLVVKRSPTRETVLAAALRRGLEVVRSPSPDLCDYSWLPMTMCGCGRHLDRTEPL